MKQTRLFWILPLLILFACGNDDDNNDFVPLEPADRRVLVINEGNFGQANGSLTEINLDNLNIRQDVIGEANGGILTGDVAQSAYHHNGKIYVVINVDGKVLILDSDSYEQTSIIENQLSNPRYLCIHDGKIYITNWNSDFTNSYVAVFQENDLSFLYKIDTDPGTERIYFDDERFWVTNSFTNTVQTFLPGQTEVDKTFIVDQGPNGIAGYENRLVVICQNSGTGLPGAIYEFDKQLYALSDTFALNFTPGPDIIANVNRFYFFESAGENVYSSQLNDSFTPANARIIFNVKAFNTLYGLDVSPDGTLWLADAKGFTENGRVYQYAVGGNFIRSYETGIGPGYFLFF